MKPLSDREVRLLCWKVQQGKPVPKHKLFALMDALLARRCLRIRRRAVNDNKAPRPAECRERERLFEVYAESVARWMQKAEALGGKAGTRSGDYALLWKAVVNARLTASAARHAYQQHMLAHGCGSPDGGKHRRPRRK